MARTVQKQKNSGPPIISQSLASVRVFLQTREEIKLNGIRIDSLLMVTDLSLICDYKGLPIRARFMTLCKKEFRSCTVGIRSARGTATTKPPRARVASKEQMWVGRHIAPFRALVPSPGPVEIRCHCTQRPGLWV